MPPDTPINIVTASKDYVHTQSATVAAYVSNGTGTSPQEQYLCYHPDRNDLSLIMPGEVAVFQSMQTGLWCRIAPLDSNSSAVSGSAALLGMLCDQASAAAADNITYIGDGLAFLGTPLVAQGRGQPLLLANASDSGQGNLSLPVAPPQPGGPRMQLLARPACLPGSTRHSRALLVPFAVPPHELNSHWRLATHFAAGPILPSMPYNLWAPGTCQVTSPASFMICPDGGDGTSAPEQFVAYRPDNGGSPIMPGEPMYLQSVQTGRFCRVVQQATRQQIACDQSSTETATQLVYTGSGASYNGQPFINPGSSQPIYFGTAAAAAQAAAFLPPPIPTNTAMSIAMPGRGFLRTDNVTAYAYCGNGNGLTPPELFVAIDPSDPTAKKTVRPGQRVLLRSLQTGLILRLAAFVGDPDAVINVQALAGGAGSPPPRRARAASVSRPPALAVRQARPPPKAPAARSGAAAFGAASSGDGGSVWGALADQPIETGTVFTYTVTGLTFMGEPMRTRGIFYPLLWRNTSALNGTSGVAFTPVTRGWRPELGPRLLR